MVLKFGNDVISETTGTVTYNGNNVNKVVYNGTTVWEKNHDIVITGLTWEHVSTSWSTSFINNIYYNNVPLSSASASTPTRSSSIGQLQNIYKLKFSGSFSVSDWSNVSRLPYVAFYSPTNYSYFIFSANGLGTSSGYNNVYTIPNNDLLNLLSNNIYYSFSLSMYPGDKSVSLEVFETYTGNQIYNLPKYTDSSITNNFPSWITDSNILARTTIWNMQSQDENYFVVSYTQNS